MSRYLAMTLNNRLERACRQWAERAGAHRNRGVCRPAAGTLAASQPEQFKSALARSLVTLASLLTFLGREDEALAAMGEAIALNSEIQAATADESTTEPPGAASTPAEL